MSNTGQFKVARSCRNHLEKEQFQPQPEQPTLNVKINLGEQMI